MLVCYWFLCTNILSFHLLTTCFYALELPLFPLHSEKNTFWVKIFGIDTWEVFNMSISRRKILLFIDFWVEVLTVLMVLTPHILPSLLAGLFICFWSYILPLPPSWVSHQNKTLFPGKWTHTQPFTSISGLYKLSEAHQVKNFIVLWILWF